MWSSKELQPFLDWVVQYPLLSEPVETAFSVLHQLADSNHPTDIRACCAALQKLHMIAVEGKFGDLAAVFSRHYDRYCRALLPPPPGVAR